jgi:hypothetical protein
MTGSMPTTGRWGWYKDHEGNEFQRVSSLIKKVETDTYNLDLWKQRQVAVGMSRRDDLVVAVKAMKAGPKGWTKEERKTLDGIAEKASEAAKDSDGGVVGTALHLLTERLDRGEDLESVVKGLPAGPAQSIRAYEFLVRANGWQTIEVERTVVNDILDVSGTFDRVTFVPGLAEMMGPGMCQHGHDHQRALPVIMDVKSEKDPTLNGLHIATQLAIYSRSHRMWLPTPEYVPAPCVRQDVGIVVHLDREGDAVPYFVNLNEGWEAALAARAQSDREARSKRKLGAAGAWFAVMPGIKRPAPAQLLSEQAVAADYANPSRPAAPGALDDVDRQAIEVIWLATDMSALANVWKIYTQTVGREWKGRVAEAAEARLRQIQCPQRALHTSGKCSCGWSAGIAP